MKKLSLTYSVADQNFAQTKSVGIFNISMMMAEVLAVRPEIGQLSVLTNHTLADRLRLPKSVVVRECNQAISGKFGRLFWDQWQVYDQARDLGNDWLFLPKGFASFLRPCPMNLATCVADIMQEFYREKYPRYGSRLEHLYFQKAFGATMRHSRVVFTISDFTTAEIKRLAAKLGWKIPPVKTIGIGFRREEHPRSEKQDRIVVLAGRFPHKRTDLAVKYFSRWQQETKFPGIVDWIGSLPEGTVLPEFKNWKRHQRLPESEYRKLISQARALVFFSEYEGFGMPPVEAAIAGTCPVFSAIPATQEVMGDTGYPFLNESYDAFHDAMEKALSVSAATIGEWAESLLRRHDPERVVDRVINAMLECDQ